MTKYERLEADRITALKLQAKIRKDTLTTLVDECRKATIPKKAGEPRRELTDELVDEVLLAQKKIVEEQIATCPRTSEYTDLCLTYQMSLQIIKQYAPEVISDADQITTMINEILSAEDIELTKSNQGKIMKAVMPKLKSQHCDMKIVQAVLKEMLQ